MIMPDFPIDRLSDRASEKIVQDDDDTLANKLGREAYLLAAGTAKGIGTGISESVADPLGTGVRLAGSVGLGLTLGYLQRGAGLGRLVGEVAGAGLGVSFAADVLAPGRLSTIGSALSDTWNDKSSLDNNVRKMQDGVGRLVFDTALMAAGGAFGAKLGRHFIPEPISVSKVFGELKLYSGETTWNGRSLKTYAKAFENFPHQAKGFVDVGRDALVIELTGNRMLKILKSPLPPNAGTRYFDASILEQATVGNGHIPYLVQPKVELCQSKAVAKRFAQDVWKSGYNFWGLAPDQLGYLNGKLVLIDYHAVAKRTVL